MRNQLDRVAENQSFQQTNSDCGSAVMMVLALMFIYAIANMGGF